MTSSDRPSLYRRHRFPPDVIAYAVWLYFRFPLSLRMLEDLLAERGIVVSHRTIRLWAEKFGREFAGKIRRRSAGNFDDKWHLDEVVITIRGKKHWLWQAVDQNGFVLNVLVQSRRNAKAAERLMRKLLSRQGTPRVMITLSRDIASHCTDGQWTNFDLTEPQNGGLCLGSIIDRTRV